MSFISPAITPTPSRRASMPRRTRWPAPATSETCSLSAPAAREMLPTVRRSPPLIVWNEGASEPISSALSTGTSRVRSPRATASAPSATPRTGAVIAREATSATLTASTRAMSAKRNIWPANPKSACSRCERPTST